MHEIRELNENDLPAWAQVAVQAYRRGDQGDGPPHWPEGDFTRFGLFEQGRQVAQFHLWHYEIFFDGRRVPMGGVASVACLPLARGKGYVEALLARGLEHMQERGELLSMLHAFLVGLYRPMGWEWTGSQRSYSFPLQALPRDLEVGNVREAGPEDWEKLRDLYETEASRYRGPLVRPPSWWRDRLQAATGFRHYFFLSEDPEPQGYLYLQLKEARVRELVWRTPAAYRSLLGVLRRHRSQIETFAWDAPPDDPLWHYAANWDVKTAWEPPFSARVVDVPAALALRTVDASFAGRLTLRTEDPLAPWNTGCWRVDTEGGAVQATRTGEEPQVTCDIGAFSQLFFGDPDAAALRHAGRLSVRDEAGFGLLQALCPPALVWSNNGF